MFAASLRLFSGRLADKTRAYWTIAILGYAINIIVVPALAFAGSWKSAALLIIAERTGKALRGPSRDVLLSGATNKVGHGFGFGVHAAFDQAGAVMGPLFVAYAVAKTNHFGPAFIWLAVPAVGAFAAMLIARAINPDTELKAPKRIDLRRGGWSARLRLRRFSAARVSFPADCLGGEGHHSAALRGGHGRQRNHRCDLWKTVRPRRSVRTRRGNSGIALRAPLRILRRPHGGVRGGGVLGNRSGSAGRIAAGRDCAGRIDE
jgi:hypothetical protein